MPQEPTQTASETGLARLDRRIARDLDYLNYPPRNWVVPHDDGRGEQLVDVVIVGGGMCGLTLAFALRRVGVGNIRLIDSQPHGEEGPWATYARMTTLRSPKHLVGPALDLPSLTFRAWYEAQFGVDGWESLGRIDRTMWMDYLRWYRRVLDLPVENGVTMTSLQPEGAAIRLDIERASGPDVLRARKVVLATGRDGLGGPYTPAVAAGLPADRCSHSADDIDFAALAGKRVAVLGGGASACDNAGVALEMGAAEVRQFVRRDDLPRVNKSKGAVYAGYALAFPQLDDAWRWRFLHYVLDEQVPPPRESMLRLTRHANYHLQLGCPWRRAEADGDGIAIDTPRGVFHADHAIIGTGFDVDISRRSELSALAGQVLLWQDRVEIDDGDLSRQFGRFPYLGPDFAFLPRDPDGPGWLANVHCFNYASTLSHGPVSGDIPLLGFGAERLARAVAASFFDADKQAHFADLQAFDEPELLGDEWSVDDAAPPQRRQRS